MLRELAPDEQEFRVRIVVESNGIVFEVTQLFRLGAGRLFAVPPHLPEALKRVCRDATHRFTVLGILPEQEKAGS